MVKDMIKVSVIVPVYNVEKYLADCLDCLIQQTLKEIEIIAVNDGSTDGSLRILNEYAKQDKRIKVITQENGGVSAARNKGLQIACGEFVGFVDSDDWVDADFFEKLYGAAQAENADVAAGEMRRCGGSRKNEKIISYKKKIVLKSLKDKYYKLLGGAAYCYICNKIYRRDVLAKSGIVFPVGLVYEDVCWLPRVIGALGKAVAVNGVAYFYRQNMSSITNMTPHSEKMLQDWRAAREVLIKFAGVNNLTVPFSMLRKEYFRILGMPLMAISYGDTGYKVYLCGICVFEKYVRSRI